MRTLKKILVGALLIVLLSLPLVVYAKAQAITDWWQLRGYTPPVTVAQLATQDAMTPYARHIFYVNRPKLTGNVTIFRQECSENEQTIVLGCYHPDQQGIDVYSVNDPRLNGVQQVTAAHEMLHAAYDRLSSHDKKYVDGLLEDYYQHDLTDQRIIDTMKAYQQTEPGQVVNEMNSVFGTEIPNLPSALETYYQKYFVNRQIVAGYAQSYQAQFTDLTNQISGYDQQLASLKQQINSEEQSLSSQLSQVNADRAKLDSQKSSGDITSYNAGVDSFNSEVDAYNNGVQKLKNDIADYNALVGTRNSIASELQGLQSEIDTRLTTQSSK